MTEPDQSASFETDDRRAAEYFEERALRYGSDPRALDWSTRESQQERFSALSQIGLASGDRVLDVGCGQGDYYLWLREQGIDTDYTGLDISARMIGIAKANVVGAKFIAGTLATVPFDLGGFDWVTASGIFYLRQFQPYEFLRVTIARMFEISRKGVAFNTLADWGGGIADDGEFRAKPTRVLEIGRGLTPKIVMRANYHPADVTFHLFKAGPAE